MDIGKTYLKTLTLMMVWFRIKLHARTLRKYIGKKQIHSYRGKGKGTKNRKRVITESKWREYTSL